jgi:hypothetical protein
MMVYYCGSNDLNAGASSGDILGRGLHLSTFKLKLSRFKHKMHPKLPQMPRNTS